MCGCEWGFVTQPASNCFVRSSYISIDSLLCDFKYNTLIQYIEFCFPCLNKPIEWIEILSHSNNYMQSFFLKTVLAPHANSIRNCTLVNVYVELLVFTHIAGTS